MVTNLLCPKVDTGFGEWEFGSIVLNMKGQTYHFKFLFDSHRHDLML